MTLAGVPGLSQVAQGLAGLALVTPILTPTYGPISSNPNNFGQSLGTPLMFDIEGENSVILQSEITDHVIETNSTISANVALRPEKITVHGFKGEVTNLFPAFLPPASQVQSVLAAVSAFAPSFSVSAMNVINEAQQSYQAIQSAVNGAVTAWNSISGGQNETVISSGGILNLGAVQTKQQLIFAQFYGYWSSQLAGNPPSLFVVQTPWAIFLPCAIEEMRWVQDEKTNSLSDVFITFKMLRFATTSTPANQTSPGSRAQAQYAPTVQNGNASLGQDISIPAGLGSRN